MNTQIYVSLVSKLDEEALADALVRRFPEADVIISEGHTILDRTDIPSQFEPLYVDSVEVRGSSDDQAVWEEAVWILQKQILISNLGSN